MILISNASPENRRNNLNEKDGMPQILNNIDNSLFENMTVDEVIEKLKSMVENGEIIIDGVIGGTQQTQDEDVSSNDKGSKG